MKKSNTGKKSAKSMGFFRASAFGALIGIGAAVIAVAVLSGAAASAEDPMSFSAVFAYAALFLGSLITGISSVKLDGSGDALTALIGGAGYVLLMWLASIAFRGGSGHSASAFFMLAMYAGCVLTAFLGGLTVRQRRGFTGVSKKNPTMLVRKQLGRR